MERDQSRGAEIVRLLRETYPEADCTLDERRDPWRLLVSAILAAQCTDARVNLITPGLFVRWPDVQAMSRAPQAELEAQIRSCGLFRNKAKAILASSRTLIRSFGGEVPRTREALLSLPGVGRKIANLILGDAYGIPAVVVDTHCARITRLIGLTDAVDPARIERDIEMAVPPEDWIDYGHLMVAHGRAICIARRPDCGRCPISSLCDTGRLMTGDQALG